MFFLTRAGRNAMLKNASLNAQFDNIRFGTGRYVSQNNDTRTAMQTPIITSPISTRSSANGRMQLMANIRTEQATDIYEVGIFDRTGVLLAISSSNDRPLFSTTANLNHSITLTVTI